MADARVAELAALSGEKLVDLLRTTYRRVDFEAVARVLKARDRRFAEAKAALSDIDALRRKHDAILGPRRRPRVEAVEGTAPLLGIASGNPMRRDEPRVEELEDAPLSPPLKRPRQCETSAFESRRTGGQGQSNSAATLGNYVDKSSPAKSVHSVAPKERTGQLAGSSSAPKDPKQGRRAVEPEKWGGGMARTAPLLSPGRSVLPKGSSGSNHGRARFGKKQSSSSDGILGPPPKWNGKITRTPMVESSSRSANKDAGAVMSPCRQAEDSRMIAKGGTPIGEAGMVAASPSLSIRSLSAQELQAYCLKPGRTPPASCMQIETQNFRDLAKGGNGLSMKRVDVSSKENGGWGLKNIQKHRENSNDNTNATSVQLI